MNQTYGGSAATDDVSDKGLCAMTANEAMEIATACARAGFPPTNQNVLIRAIYAIQSRMMDMGEVSKQDWLRFSTSINVIMAWSLEVAGLSALNIHGEAIDAWVAAFEADHE